MTRIDEKIEKYLNEGMNKKQMAKEIIKMQDSAFGKKADKFNKIIDNTFKDYDDGYELEEYIDDLNDKKVKLLYDKLKKLGYWEDIQGDVIMIRIDEKIDKHLNERKFGGTTTYLGKKKIQGKIPPGR